MPRTRHRQLVAFATSAAASTAATWALARGGWAPGPAAEKIAVATMLVAAAGTTWVLGRSRDPRWRPPALGDRAMPLLVAPLLALIAATGGFRSPALAAAALAILWCVRGRSPVVAGMAAASLVGIVALLDALLHRPFLLGDALVGATIVSASLVVPRHLLDAAGGIVTRERERVERLGGLLGQRAPTPVRLGAVGGPRGDASAPPAAGRHVHGDLLARYLRDVQEWAAADEAAFWRWDESRREVVPAAWSTPGADGPQGMREEWGPLVSWTTVERLTQLHPEADSAQLALCAVEWGASSVGTLSVSSATRVGRSAEELRVWLPRFAAHLAALSDLLDERAAVSRRNREVSALLSATRDFPTVQKAEKLAHALFDLALVVTSARRAALVRWDAGTGHGRVQHVTVDHPLPKGLVVTDRSYVGAACVEGRPVVWEDARLLDPASAVYGAGEPRRTIGALAVIPFFSRGEVAGALVIEGDAPGDVHADDRRPLRQLVDLAAASFDRLTRMADETRLATTDTLTGLKNRRFFDDQFVLEAARVGRTGAPLAIIVADVDHFKRVNDSYGHDAGDAVLRAVATTFAKSVRDIDTPARFGGEELVVLLPETGLDGALVTAERLRQAVAARPIVVGGREISVTMSFGVAAFPDSASTRDACFAAADRALYRAKSDGRNCVRSAPPKDFQTQA